MKQLQLLKTAWTAGLLRGLILAVITLAFASCASQPQASTTDNSNSPLERQNGNGLASAMH